MEPLQVPEQDNFRMNNGSIAAEWVGVEGNWRQEAQCISPGRRWQGQQWLQWEERI